MTRKIDDLINAHQNNIITSYEFEHQLLEAMLKVLKELKTPHKNKLIYKQLAGDIVIYNQAIDDCKEAIKLLFDNE